MISLIQRNNSPSERWYLLATIGSDQVAIVQSLSHVCDSMDCTTSGFSALHHLPEFAQTHPLSRWCHPTISSSVTHFSSCPQSFPVSGYFPMSWLFTSGSQSIGTSASASVLPLNIQDWFPLGLTSLSSLQSLQSKGLSRLFSKTQFKSINSLVLSLLYGPILTSIKNYWKKPKVWLVSFLSAKWWGLCFLIQV